VLPLKERSKGREVVRSAMRFLLLLVERVSPGDCQGFVAQAVFLSWGGRSQVWGGGEQRVWE